MMQTPAQELIWSRAIPVPESGCWLWTSTIGGDGYGRNRTKRADWGQAAHRDSYAAFRGDIPKGMFVCHTCDTPSCVNPDHLFLGTASDNMRDMHRKGRGGRWSGGLRTDAHCYRGHTFDDLNTYVHDGEKKCRTCRNAATLKYRARKAAEVAA